MRYSNSESPTYQIHEAIMTTVEEALHQRKIDKYERITRNEKSLHMLEIGTDIICRVQKHGMVIAYQIDRTKNTSKRIEFLYMLHYADPQFDVDNVVKSIVERVAREHNIPL